MLNRRSVLLAAACTIAATWMMFGLAQPPSAEPAGEGPSYSRDGDLLPPTNYRQWTYLTSGLA